MFLLAGVFPDEINALLLSIELSLMKLVLAEFKMLGLFFVNNFHS